jgi:hypothetical protein
LAKKTQKIIPTISLFFYKKKIVQGKNTGTQSVCVIRVYFSFLWENFKMANYFRDGEIVVFFLGFPVAEFQTH